MIKSKEFIRKKKKQKAIRRLITLGVVGSIAIGVSICTVPIFDIKNINVEGLKILNNKEINQLVEFSKGSNIVRFNSDEIVEVLKKNKYIESVEVKKSMPSTLKINVKEKEIGYYIVDNNSKYILDKNLTVIDKVDNITGKGYAEIVGIEPKSLEVGSCISDNDLVKRAGEELLTIVKDNTSNKKIEKIDISNPIDIKMYIGDVQIKVGDYDNIRDKVNKAINILQDKEVNIVKGYIDVSYEGLPVVKKE